MVGPLSVALLATAVLLPGRSPAVVYRRARPPACCDEPPTPYDLDDLDARVRTACSAALVDGKNSLSIEAFGAGRVVVPTATVALAACASAMDAADGRSVLLLLPTLEAVAEATSAVAAWPAEERERLRIATLRLRGAPVAGDEQSIGAVVLCGVSLTGDGDDGQELLRAARAWLRCARVSLCVNAHVPLLRFEAALVEPAFTLIPYAVSRQLLRYEALRFVGGFLSERIYVSPHPAAASSQVKSSQAAASSAAAANRQQPASSGGGPSGARLDVPSGSSSAEARAGGDGAAPPTELVRTEDFGTVVLSRTFAGPWQVQLSLHPQPSP
jgi:hypothetical protein